MLYVFIYDFRKRKGVLSVINLHPCCPAMTHTERYCRQQNKLMRVRESVSIQYARVRERKQKIKKKLKNA